ncbi:MAG: RNA polymerase sigma factor [Novosphingobium sp.]
MLSSIKGQPAEAEPLGLESQGPELQGHDWDAIRGALRRYLRARGAQDDVADDVAQETLARLVELARTQQIASMLALGFRIADNVLVDMHRRNSRLTAEIDEDFRSEEPSLNRVLDSRRAMEVFDRCLKRMPALRREVLVRRRLNQESCRAIGDDLHMSAKAVEKHITRGMIDLRRALDQAGIDLVGQD